MNKIRLSLLSFGILFGSVVFAQEAKQLSQQKLTKEQRMEKRMDNFGEKLDLNADQKAKITEIRKNSFVERQKLKDDAIMDKSKKGEAIKGIYSKEQAEISKILTPDQSLKWDAMKEDRRSNYKKRDHKYQNKRKRNEKFKGKRKSGKNHYKGNKRKNKLAPAKE